MKMSNERKEELDNDSCNCHPVTAGAIYDRGHAKIVYDKV